MLGTFFRAIPLSINIIIRPYSVHVTSMVYTVLHQSSPPPLLPPSRRKAVATLLVMLARKSHGSLVRKMNETKIFFTSLIFG